MYVIPVNGLFSGYVCRFNGASGVAAVIGTFIRRYIEYSFPVVLNVIQKSPRLPSSKCEGTVSR